MKKDWLVKILALSVVVLFVSVSFQPVFAIENKIPVIDNQIEKNKSYVDPNIHLKRIHLPILKRSFNYFRNSNYYNVEIGKVMEKIIKMIDTKGSVNSEDVENILKDSEIAPVDVYVASKIGGSAISALAYGVPLFLINIIGIPFLFRVIGVGGLLYWVAEYGFDNYHNIEITVGSKIYRGEHTGFGFGFFGYAQTFWQFWIGGVLHINGYILLVFVLPYVWPP